MKSPLSEEFYNKYVGRQPDWGFNGLGYVTYKRTYARSKDDGSTEEWHETVKRCVDWLYQVHQELNINFSTAYYEELFDIVFNLKANFSGRMLWQAGSKTVEKLGATSLNNCWGTKVDSINSFCATMDNLMLGGGVGYNIQRQYVDKLPPVKTDVSVTRQEGKDADFIVPDTREGWIELLQKTLEAHLVTGESFTYSCHEVRPYGAPIKGFGGVASGPEPLAIGINKINHLLKSRAGYKLRPIDCLDIMNCIGELVVAGNVRRSAQIALGDPDDVEYINAKRWSEGTVPNHRAFSNNSVVANDINDLDEYFWDGYKMFYAEDIGEFMAVGEPYGLMNLENARRQGRIGDTHRCDPDVTVTNPCAEISLAPSDNDGGAEPCNLCEIYLNNIEDEEEFSRVAQIMYYAVKTVTLLPYHRKETEKIVRKNKRLGIGITGVVQSPDLIKSSVLDNVYRSIEHTDREFSQEYGFGESIKLTTIKPSGTLSLLAGATPGVHPAWSQYHIRRVRMASNDELVELCRNAGYNVEYALKLDQKTYDYNTCVVDFPVMMDDGVTTADKMRAVDQLNMIKYMQTWWADNQVSCTVTFKQEELPEIREWLQENYNDYVKTLSFMMYQDHGFAQAPYEAIDKETYEEKVKHLKDIDFDENVEEKVLAESVECMKGGCPVR